MIKKLVLSLTLVFTIVSFASASSYTDIRDDANENGWDTHIHIGLGAGITAITFSSLPEKMKGWKKHSIAILLPTALAIIKELVVDEKYSWKDVGGYTAGSISVSIVDVKF